MARKKEQDIVDLKKSRYYSRQLLRTLYDIQKMRVGFANRLKIDAEGKPQKGSEEYLALLPERSKEQLRSSYEVIEGQEKLFVSIITAEVERSALYNNWLKDIKGVGPLMAAVLLYEIDIHLIDKPSALYAYAGISPGMAYGYVLENSKTEFQDKEKRKPVKVKVRSETKIKQDRKTVGFLCPYNQFLKTKPLGVLASSFLKSNSPYRDFYDNYKNRLTNQLPLPGEKPRTKSHIHNMAMRYMIKRFLSDFYVKYRESEGLPIRVSYEEEFLHRKHHGPTVYDEVQDKALLDDASLPGDEEGNEEFDEAI